MNILMYLLQVSTCTAAFYLFYFVCLRKLTFFVINRWYLLITLIMSFGIPLITIPVSSVPQLVVQQPIIYQYYMQQPQQIQATMVTVSDDAPFNWVGLFTDVYYLVALVFFINLLITLLVFWRRTKGRQLLHMGNIKVIKCNKRITNSSFFNIVFLNDDELKPEEIKQVLAHEVLHIRLMHSMDRLLSRVAQVLLWFNPFVYCYLRSIEENHEFEVDRIAARDVDKGRYAKLLLRLSISGNHLLYNGFSKEPLKKRITMLFNQPSSEMKKTNYLLILPLAVLSCLAFASVKGKIDNSKKRINAIADFSVLGKHPLVMIDTAKYRQNIKRTPQQNREYDRARKKTEDFRKTDEYRQKYAQTERVMGKQLPYKVVGFGTFGLAGNGSSIALENDGYTFYIRTSYGQEKQLENKFKIGDVLYIKVYTAAMGQGEPVQIQPATVLFNGEKIFQLAEADQIPKEPFLYEANKVRFAYGQVTSITKYPNGKWKSAVVEVINGYRIKFNIKPNAPEFNGIAYGDHVRFRFIGEKRTGAKEYTVNEWISLTTDIKDYGIKNPELFSKFYKKI